jgi:hypothetical protein
MSQQLERDVRFLKRYSIGMTAVVLVMGVGAFVRPPHAEKFTEIDVERINVREPDGSYRLVISNRPRSIGPIYKNRPFAYPGGGRPGLIWFNDEGTENGGMTFTGSRDSTGKYRASTHMSFDQFDQDQILNLDYTDDQRGRLTGFTIQDRADWNIYDMWKTQDSITKIPDTATRAAALRRLVTTPHNGVPLNATRAFFGKDRAKNASVVLSDPMGRPRLRILVDSLGAARIEFLDETGKVTKNVGPNG